MSAISIKPVPSHHLRKALRLSLAGQDHSAAALELRVNTFLEYARALSFDLSRQWFCESNGRPIAACTCIESPGRTAMLLLPSRPAAGSDPRARHQLITHVINEEAKRDVRLLQSLIEIDDDQVRLSLEHAGFREIAVLLYLELNFSKNPIVHMSTPVALHETSFVWSHYDEVSHRRFADLIQATYEGGLDCPGLSELRDIDDVIAGHKAAGRFDPTRWLLLECDGVAIACVLLSESPLRPMLELVYMGVRPEARGNGVGSYVLSRAIHLAQSQGYQGITLAVDARNAPARTLYQAAGFNSTHSRRAMIRPLGLTF